MKREVTEEVISIKYFCDCCEKELEKVPVSPVCDICKSKEICNDCQKRISELDMDEGELCYGFYVCTKCEEKHREIISKLIENECNYQKIRKELFQKLGIDR